MNKPEPRQWPEAPWCHLLGQVRAERPYRPAAWKNGACCVVAPSFDSDHETSALRDGGRALRRMSRSQYGNRVGIPRVLALLDRYGIQATFSVPAVAALRHAALAHSDPRRADQ